MHPEHAGQRGVHQQGGGGLYFSFLPGQYLASMHKQLVTRPRMLVSRAWGLKTYLVCMRSQVIIEHFKLFQVRNLLRLALKSAATLITWPPPHQPPEEPTPKRPRGHTHNRSAPVLPSPRDLVRRRNNSVSLSRTYVCAPNINATHTHTHTHTRTHT